MLNECLEKPSSKISVGVLVLLHGLFHLKIRDCQVPGTVEVSRDSHAYVDITFQNLQSGLNLISEEKEMLSCFSRTLFSVWGPLWLSSCRYLKEHRESGSMVWAVEKEVFFW